MMKKAFTLIELLIVVAIIAILAAIAVPNFLEAQIRSKVSRVKADLRSVSTALESYAIDNNGKYPFLRGYLYLAGSNQYDRGGLGAVIDLTTPVAYLTTVLMMDPFVKSSTVLEYGLWDPTVGNRTHATYHYVNVVLCRKESGRAMDNRPSWFQFSMGPDYKRGPNPINGGDWLMGNYATSNADPAKTFDAWNYDATNGTTSGGDIIRHQ